MLGIAYGAKGLHDKAIVEFEEAIRLAPEELSWRVNLDKAMALKEKGSANSSPGRK